MTEILQKTLTTQKEVLIESEGIFVRSKSIREDLEFRIRFEELGFDTVRKRIKTANFPFYFFLAFDLLYVYLLIQAMISKAPFQQQLFWLGALLFFVIFTIGAYCSRNKDVIYLTGGSQVLELLATKPDAATVTAFIAAVHQAMRQHYKIKYTRFDADTTYEMKVQQLKWLKEMKVLTDEEYSTWLQTIKTDQIIGF